MAEGAPELAEFDPDDPDEPGERRGMATDVGGRFSDTSTNASAPDEPWIELDLDILLTVPTEANEEIGTETGAASGLAGPGGGGRSRRKRAAGPGSKSTKLAGGSPGAAPDSARPPREGGGR
jgi:hypothetical protein